MLAPGNAGRESAIPISEIIHHSVRRTSSEAFTARREVSSKRARDGTFFLVFSWFPFFLPLFLLLLSTSSTCQLRPSFAIRLRFSISFRGSIRANPPSRSKKSTSKYASGLRDSALRSGRFRIMDRMDGRSRAASFFSHPQPLLGATSL